MKVTHHANVQLKIGSNPLAEHFRQFLQGMQGIRLTDTTGSPAADLLIMELSQTEDPDFKQLETWLSGNQVGEIFLTGENPAPDVLMQAMRIGVKEFIPIPLNKDDVHSALERFLTRFEQRPAPEKKNSRVISVCGSKGGVGVTTVAVNLAVAYSGKTQPLSTVLLDLNTLLGEIPLFLEISPRFHWGEITKNIDRLDNTFLMNILTRHRSGVYILPSPGYLNGHPLPTAVIMQRLLELMRRMFDIIIIDGVQSLSEAALQSLQMSDDVLLVTTLSLQCLSNTNRLLRSLTNMGFVNKERIKVVVNRYTKKNDITIQDAEAGIDQPIFWQIPNDYKTTMAAINTGKPLFEAAPNASILQSLVDLSEKLVPSAPERIKKRWSLFNR